MALPSTGPISISDINIEQGNPSNRNVSMGTLRTEWYNKTGHSDFSGSGSISLSAWRGKSWGSPLVMEFYILGGTTLTLPTVSYGTYDYNVDWGDGNSDNITSWNSSDRSHLYTTTGTYTVTIKGKYSRQDPSISTSYTNALREVVYFGDVGIESLNSFLMECGNLYYVWPIEKFDGTDAGNMLYDGGYNTNLTVHPDLFKNCPNITNFNWTFAYSGLSGEIPQDLFRYCPQATEFIGTFSVCKNTTYLPSTLFDYNPLIQKVTYLFEENDNLGGTAPALWNRPGITEHTLAFAECYNLSNYSIIPSNWK